MIKIGGVVYRNIQEQVAKNTQDIAKIQRKPVLQVKKVDELPEEGEEGILYLLPASDPEIGNYFEEYLWIDSAWELIGSSAVDISNMMTTDTEQEITGEKTFAFSLKPTASGLYDLGSSTFKWSNIYLNSAIYIGSFSSTYINTDAYGGIAFNVNSNTKFLVREATTYINNNLYPLSDGTRDIGTTGAAFKNIYLSGDINIGSGKIWYNGSLFVNDDLSPSNSSISLGKTSYPWKDIHLSGDVYIANGKGLLASEQSNRPMIRFDSGNGIVDTDWGFCPYRNATYDLGLSYRRWKDLYLSGNITDGTNSASVADIAALITYAKAQGWIS